MSIVLVSATAVMLYQGMLYSQRTLMRSRAKLDAQGIAFDALWAEFNIEDFHDIRQKLDTLTTPLESIFSTNGTLRVSVEPYYVGGDLERWEMTAQVWAASNSVLFSIIDDSGTVVAEYDEPLATYTLIRYAGDRE